MVDGPNMYAYARNNPVNARDPSGCMSVPPRYINGGGADLEECPGSGYETYNDCVSAQHGTPPAGYDSVAEYCSHICYGQESTSTGGSSGSGLPEPPTGAECAVNAKWWGTKTVCNKEATEYLYSLIGGGGWEVDASLSLGAIMGGLIYPPVGFVLGETEYLRTKVTDCHDRNQLLVIMQTWISIQPFYKCIG